MQEMRQEMDLHDRNLPRGPHNGLTAKMSIRAMEEEISNQAGDLPNFASQLRRRHLPRLKLSSLVFAGSGDSYAAAVFAQELSRGEALASDPYELFTDIRRVRGKCLVIVSVSGRTRTNVQLARKAKGIATTRLAITANPESPLAKECDEILQLEYRTYRTITSGTISFTTSLLACAFLVGSIPGPAQVKKALSTPEQATNLVPAQRGTFVFTGSGVNYALALYGAAKMNEVLGARAEAVYPEQLGHSKLFSIDKEHDLIICLSNGLDKAGQLHKLLRKSGFQSIILSSSENNRVLRSLKIAIYLQRLPLAIAKRRRMVECSFLAHLQRLKLSNKMIY
jgi:fructoselysine-6-P-deglycase FrlB-like protein